MKKNESFQLYTIGYVNRADYGVELCIKEEFRKGLKGLNEFSHIVVFFWAHKLDKPRMRQILTVKPPYAPSKQMGIFATRSPVRPNPILTTACKISELIEEEGIILVPNIDAEDGSPILDIKPYYPCLDQVVNARIPEDVPKEFGAPLPEEGIGLEE